MRKWTHWRVESIEKQRGISLLTVLLILLIVSLLGTASVQITMMSERGARNDRDMDLAWQAAEMGLVGAEIEVQGPNSASNSRTQKILSGHVNIPSTGCQTNGDWRGFCFYETKVNGKSRPTWLTVDIAETGSTSPSVEFGTFTGFLQKVGHIFTGHCRHRNFVNRIFSQNFFCTFNKKFRKTFIIYQNRISKIINRFCFDSVRF